MAGGLWLWRTIADLDRQLVDRFAGRRWQLPSKIYSDSQVLYAGSDVPAVELLERLVRLDYRRIEGEVEHRGEYRVDLRTGRIDVYLRDFSYPDRAVAGVPVRLRLAGGRLDAIERLDTGEPVDSIEVEPEVLAGIYERSWEERRVMRLRELPATLVRAVLAAEDRRFFEHPGIDVRGVGRALWANLRSGRVVQGGSTLTQQLVKNFFLTEARTMNRKLTEAAMALLAERHFTKLEILETYLNEIYLGQRGARGIYGVWEGAKFYFGKEPKDMTLAETAMLAGLIRAPARLSPTRNPEAARRRRAQVLAALRTSGEIGEDEYRQALAEPLPDRLPTIETTDAAYFVDFVRGELEGHYPADTLTSEGYRIFTSLDPLVQRAAEKAVDEGLAAVEKAYPKLTRREEPLQACLVALQPRTGEIRAMVGGRAYRSSQFNRVTQARRQPGSVFKPIVFLTAFEEEERTGARQYLPTRKLLDEPFVWKYEGREWAPENYKDEYHGEVMLRRALELSLNSATARLAEEVGLERIRDMAVRLGFPSDLATVPSLVLGSLEVTPLEVAQAFAAIANLGFRTEPLSIRAVLDGEGGALTRSSMTAEQVVSPRVAYLVTNLMEGVLTRGTAHGAGLDFPAAGKTGTTNDGRDAWFVGFTPDLLAVVWVGFDEGEPFGLSGAQAALPIWTRFMKAAVALRSPTPFLVPPGIQTVTIDPWTGQLATPGCPETLDESFLEGEAPVETCTLHGGAPAGTPEPGVTAVVPAPPLLVPSPVPTPTAAWSWWPW